MLLLAKSEALERDILGGQVNFPAMLAPMVGLSHVVLREIVREYLPKDAVTLWPTEMLNSRKIPSQVMGQTPETLLSPDDQYLIPQILGNDEPSITQSVRKLKEWGAVAIDINMGCPVKKALKHNYGVALMGDPKYAADVVGMAVQASDLPVSIKLRSGPQGDMDFLIRFVEGLVDAGASWVCLHPRLASEKRRGKADWNQIRLLRDAITIPVIGNGDIQTSQDAHQMIEATGCDAVMMGRALTARPWMMAELAADWGFSDDSFELSKKLNGEEEASEYGRVLKRAASLHQQYFGEALGLRKFRFYVKVSSSWLNYAQELISGVGKARDFDGVQDFLNRFFDLSGLRFTERTDLRY